jgi:hypothetical protein
MAYVSLKNVFASAARATPEQLDSWQKKWRVATTDGSQDSLIEFVCREAGISEDAFLQQLAVVLKWPFIDLKKVTIPTEARNKISTKIAFQYFALPTDFQNGTLQVVVSNPFDNGMLNAVQFDAKMPVQFALAPKSEIDKALKKYYGVGAETSIASVTVVAGSSVTVSEVVSFCRTAAVTTAERRPSFEISRW